MKLGLKEIVLCTALTVLPTTCKSVQDECRERAAEMLQTADEILEMKPDPASELAKKAETLKLRARIMISECVNK